MADVTTSPTTLPRLIEQAAAALATATTAAEVLDAKDKAGFAYTTAKAAARFAEAKNAHDAVIAACRKAMGDALIIQAAAQCRLADEYDAAQERGEVAGSGFKGNQWSVPNENAPQSAESIGLTRKQVHEARAVRDAEKTQPGIVRETIEGRLKAGRGPTLADVKHAIAPAPAPAPAPAQPRKAAPSPTKNAPQLGAKTILRTFEVPAGDEWKEVVSAGEYIALAEQLDTWTEALECAGLEMVEYEGGSACVTAINREWFDDWVKEEQANFEPASPAADDPERAAQLEQHAQRIKAALDRKDAAEERIAEADKEWKEASVELAKFSRQVASALRRVGLRLKEGDEVSIGVDDRVKALEWFEDALDSSQEIMPPAREPDSSERETPAAIDRVT